jgi:DNA-binding XRE family transcriptional regulator
LTIVRRQRDPRTRSQRRADERLLARLERGEALAVSRNVVEAAAKRIRTRNAERRREVARLGVALAELRRTLGLTQAEIARAIGTSKPNVCALERGRAPGISLERFLAVLETLGARTGAASPAGGGTSHQEMAFTPTAGIHSLEESLESG